MKNNKSTKPKLVSGFTLIELLVVIAIIALISGVIVSFLGTARNNSSDTSVKAALSGMRAQAELYYDTSHGYAGVCTSQVGIANMLAQATTTGGGPTGVITDYCVDSYSSWSAYANLKTSGYWCAGYTGLVKATSSPVSPWLSTSCQ